MSVRASTAAALPAYRSNENSPGVPSGLPLCIYFSLMLFIVGISTAAILYLTVTYYKLLLAGSLKSPIFHNLL